jgi:hypothetical protein
MCVHSCGRKTLEVALAHCLSVGVDRMQRNEVGRPVNLRESPDNKTFAIAVQPP